jgi:hypothetical protein
MSSVDTARDVAVLWTLDFDAELPCEASHNNGEYACSGPARWIVELRCRGKLAVCDTAANKQRQRRGSGYYCGNCDELMTECTVSFSRI